MLSIHWQIYWKKKKGNGSHSLLYRNETANYKISKEMLVFLPEQSISIPGRDGISNVKCSSQKYQKLSCLPYCRDWSRPCDEILTDNKFLSCLITVRDMSVVESPLFDPFLFLYFNSNYLIFLIKLTYHECGHGWDILWRMRTNLVRKIWDDCDLSGSSAVWPSQCCKNKIKTFMNLNLNEIILDHENKIFQKLSDSMHTFTI